MNALMEYWPVLVALFAVIVVGGYTLYVFIKRPTNTQIDKVREWLLLAVTEAEKKLGGGTGQLKLRYVYDMFLAKFPYLVQVVTFEAFSTLVNEALEKFKSMMTDNKAVKEYVTNREV